MSDDEKVPVFEALRMIYDGLQPKVDEHVKKMKTTCREGCAYCCYQLTSITLPEAALIAHELMKKPDWKALLPKLRQASLDHCFDGITNRSYFEKQIPCVFLGEDKRCGIYDSRPGCCRLHYVVSDPANCDYNSKGSTTTGLINMAPAEEIIWDFAIDAQKQNGLGKLPFVGPIPLAVLWALASEAHVTGDEAEVMKATEGLPTMEKWTYMVLMG